MSDCLSGVNTDGRRRWVECIGDFQTSTHHLLFFSFWSWQQAVKILEDDMACDIIKIGGIVRNKEVRCIRLSLSNIYPPHIHN